MEPGEVQHHRRMSYDDLSTPINHHPDDERLVTDPLLEPTQDEPPLLVARRRRLRASTRRRAFFIRALALLCACSLSVGSHYATNILGPLKSRLSREMGTSNTEFSLLISAFSLNSTWTPLLGGLMASKFGTTFTSILATGIIFTGQILLLIGDVLENVRLMAFGMFVFGLGISPLAVVQETIIVRFFKSHGLGVSMAFGLIAGKGASFVSARTSFPLTERFGSHAPFYVSTFLAGLSVVVNFVYILASKWLIDGAGAELEASDIHEEAQRHDVYNLSETQALEKVAQKRRVNLREIITLGDIFWAYVGINVLCGAIWHPFNQLAANIIEKRYEMSEQDATSQASYLFAGSLILYPICGYLVDRLRNRPIVVQLFMLSSVLTMFSHLWLVLPPQIMQTALPAILAHGAGFGFGPLLLVVLVPNIVPLKYVSTALGVHKSLEQTGTAISQTLAGLALDVHTKKEGPPTRKDSSIQFVLNIFLLLNVLQFLSIMILAYLQRRKRLATAAAALRRRASFTLCVDGLDEGTIEHLDSTQDDPPREHAPEEPSASSSSPEEDRLLPASQSHSRYSSASSILREGPPERDVTTKEEVRRGKIFTGMCGALIIFAWVLFMGTAWFRLGSKKDMV